MYYYADIVICGEEMEVFVGQYVSNNSLCIQINSQEGPFCSLSINVEEADLEPDEFVVNHDILRQHGYVQDIIKSNLFRDTGKRIHYGFCNDIPIWQLMR